MNNIKLTKVSRGVPAFTVTGKGHKRLKLLRINKSYTTTAKTKNRNMQDIYNKKLIQWSRVVNAC